ncbi:MAG: protein translocase subunit SecD [Candidatus Puniceispirillaceae bacterium]
MLQFETWKKAIVLLLVAIGILYALPNLFSRGDDKGGPAFIPGQAINLGLDLQGGSHLLLQADLNAVIAERMVGVQENLRLAFRAEKIRFRNLKAEKDSVSFALRDAAGDSVIDAQVETILRDLGRDFDAVQSGQSMTIRFNEAGLQNLANQTVDQAIEIIRRRLDPDGTKEPVIQRQGKDRILVQLPGVDDPERIKRLIGRTARLTFQLVDMRSTAQEARRSGRVPPGSMLLESAEEGGAEYLVEKRVMVSGELLENASAGFDQNNRPAVNFQLNAEGGRRFGRVTGENIGRPFAIVLDGKVVSAPVIQSQIFGSGQITGNFSVAETNELALILRAGALPAPLIILEERSVGPGLGADSIAAGQIAAVVGLALVIIYMMLSYGLFGLFADIALTVNIVLILGALSALQATLTLPGIAGIVLTMGMAVDANVLVFERIREELRGGRRVAQAIEAGYSRALSTIIDSNLTTLFAALFLFVFGSGPIKGFAVTLSLGIATSMFTALMVTRLLIVVWVNSKRPKKLEL